MRILICGINFAPEPVGIGKYTGEMAAWLAGRGHEVRVVTAPPHNPWWRVPSEFTAWKYHRDCRFEFGGKSWLQVPSSGRVDVFRSPLWVPESPNGIKRLLHLASFGLSSLPVILWQRAWCPELVLLVEPTLFCSLQVLLVAAWSGARAWLQVQDFEVDAAFELGDLPSSLLRNCALAIERRLLRKFDRVSAISGRMVERLISKGVDSSRCVLFPNWVDTNAIYPLSSPSPLRRDLGIDEDKIVVLYSGSMGKKQGLDLLADAARQHFHRSDLLYVFSGEGSYRRAFIEKTRGLSNVVHLPLQPVERLNDLLNLGDIHLLPQRADAADLVMPSKLTGMLASGRPIVATAKWGTQLALTVEGCGMVVAPGDLDAFTSAIHSLVGSKDLRFKLGQEARRYALAHFDLQRILLRFEEAIFAACNRPEIRPESGRLHSTVTRVGSSEPRLSMAASESEVAAKTSKPCSMSEAIEKRRNQIGVLDSRSKPDYSPRWHDPLSLACKRALDIGVSSLLLLLLAPLFLVLGLAVKLTSPGTVFYRWRVVGRRGCPFTGYKFRSMCSNADDLKVQLVNLNEMQGPVFKLRNDPRVTKFGSWMRRYSVDELPQLYSVLMGDMSLVGPRPPLVSEFEQFSEYQKQKLAVKPGITCLWQVSGRNQVRDLDEWVKLDLEYIRRWSLKLDLWILLKTVREVCAGSGK